MTTSPICLFHNRRYSSNLQCILNLLRVNIIKIKCDLNWIGKKSLCTCSLSNNQSVITDAELNKQHEEYEKVKLHHQWPEEIDQIVQCKILNTCDTKISIYNLFKLLCDISNETIIRKEGRALSSKRQRHHHSEVIRRRIELSIPGNQIGHLIGRNGELHKSIMRETKTRIHFNNAPYSTSSHDECPEFNLDLLQSPCALAATITGNNIEAVDNATKALEELDRITQTKLSNLFKK